MLLKKNNLYLNVKICIILRRPNTKQINEKASKNTIEDPRFFIIDID
jgi:hypothetical protein